MEETPETRPEEADDRIAATLKRIDRAEGSEAGERLEALEEAHALLEAELETSEEGQ